MNENNEDNNHNRSLSSHSPNQNNLNIVEEEQSPRSISNSRFSSEQETRQTNSNSIQTDSQPPFSNKSKAEEYSPTSSPSPPEVQLPIMSSYESGSSPEEPSSPREIGNLHDKEQLELAATSASRLGLPLPQRPSLGSTPSTEPLIGSNQQDLSPNSTIINNPFNNQQQNLLAVSSGNPFSSGEGGSSTSSLNSSIGQTSGTGTGIGTGAPKIRINDMPNSPPSEDNSQVPSPPIIPDNQSINQGNNTTFTSPFSGGSSSSQNTKSPKSNLRNSINSINTPSSPTGGGGKRFSAGSNLASGNGVITASGIELNSSTTTKNNIAARRAQRLKQAQSMDGKNSGNRYSNYTAPNKNAALNRKAFQSTRLKGEIYKPWLEQKDPALRWARWITIASIILGFAIAAVICWDGYRSVPKLGKVCSLINEDFSGGSIDSSIFQHEVRLDGYGYGSFQWTTNDAKNSYVKDGTLYIVPTLTSDDIGADAITNGYTVNLTADGTCTSTNVSNCVAVSNSSQLTIINPVKTARLITKNSHSIKYGKIEVKAKFPTGDWLWPRISMLPVNDTYGSWPRSGQINILGGRGNNASYEERGVDFAQSDLHWGPTVDLDRQYLTWGYREQRRTYFSQKYHTFGLEWNEDFMWTYIDSRVAQVMSFRFAKEPFWSRGKFPTTYTNNTEVIKLINPWLSSSENNAPFDQSFYLMIDLAVGSQDGWFPDGVGGKPWIDQSGSAMSDFWLAKTKWWDASWTSKSATAEDRAFAIDSVKMWSTC
ncbi:uncharacterized protein I206_104873 [Kwoniella pini CBS 10737]|uniref:GH16 domain-containing protein n=1 Tax=Kwoniella pini CBS 10737 TaxID=1296096 RepID=A0A1B9I819_9TREE|nr:uncharacterized protein I206_02413 [Kwoniella pini CBS 10737]OCF51698.1 hypothetical protein I206_02413 [Kwoniella pini CBS 10737]